MPTQPRPHWYLRWVFIRFASIPSNLCCSSCFYNQSVAHGIAQAHQRLNLATPCGRTQLPSAAVRRLCSGEPEQYLTNSRGNSLLTKICSLSQVFITRDKTARVNTSGIRPWRYTSVNGMSGKRPQPWKMLPALDNEGSIAGRRWYREQMVEVLYGQVLRSGRWCGSLYDPRPVPPAWRQNLDGASHALSGLVLV